MLSQHDFKRITRMLPLLQQHNTALQDEFQRSAQRVVIPAGSTVFAQGSDAETLALLLAGTVRVYTIGETGREITLYRFGAGQSCILTANAILNQQAFPAIAMVEQEAEAILIPAALFRDWVHRYAAWRDFVFAMLSERIVRMMELVDQVAFQRMDKRLMSLLLARSSGQASIQMTHQELADELGSSREVISRLLEDLAKQQLVRTARGSITILDHETMRQRILL